MASGYCVKCKAPREIAEPKQITMKNGKPVPSRVYFIVAFRQPV